MPTEHDRLFGKIAVELKYLKSKQLKKCLKIQEEIEREGRPVVIDNVLLKQGLLSKEQVESIQRKVGRQISMKIDKTGLEQFIEFVSMKLDYSFTWNPTQVRIRGKSISFKGGPVYESQLFEILLTTLQAHNLVLIHLPKLQKGKRKYFKIVNMTRASKYPTRTFKRGDKIPGGYELITVIATLNYVDPDRVVRVISGLSLIRQGIRGIRGTNAVVIIDYAANVKKLLRIIDILDI